MKSNLLFLIRLRSHWRRSTLGHGPVAHRLTGQGAFRFGVERYDGPQYPVEITHVCGRSEPAPRQRERPALVPLVRVALLTENSAFGLHICKPAATSQPCPYGLFPIEQSGVEVMPRN
jgi:hypothetical protein